MLNVRLFGMLPEFLDNLLLPLAISLPLSIPGGEVYERQSHNIKHRQHEARAGEAEMRGAKKKCACYGIEHLVRLTEREGNAASFMLSPNSAAV